MAPRLSAEWQPACWTLSRTLLLDMSDSYHNSKKFCNLAYSVESCCGYGEFNNGLNCGTQNRVLQCSVLWCWVALGYRNSDEWHYVLPRCIMLCVLILSCIMLSGIMQTFLQRCLILFWAICKLLLSWDPFFGVFSFWVMPSGLCGVFFTEMHSAVFSYAERHYVESSLLRRIMLCAYSE